MKKLLCILLVLLCCAALAAPVFADLILIPDSMPEDTGTLELIVPSAAPADVLTDTQPESAAPADVLADTQPESAAPAATKAATPSPASSGGSDNPAVLYLVVGVAALAAGFALFLLLRKKKIQ